MWKSKDKAEPVIIDPLFISLLFKGLTDSNISFVGVIVKTNDLTVNSRYCSYI